MAAIENFSTVSALPANFLPPINVQKRSSSANTAYLYIAKPAENSHLIHDQSRKISPSGTSQLNRKITSCASTSLLQGNSEINDQVSLKQTEIGHVSNLRPKNAQEFLEIFIALDKENEELEGLGLGTSRHSFRLIPKDPTLLAAMNRCGSAKKWIDQQIIQPGLKISALPLSESQKTSFINAVKATCIPRELHGIFGKALQALDPRINSVHHFSNALVDISAHILPRENAFRNEIAKKISSVLIESILPASVRKILITSSTRIADTSWVDLNLKRIYVVSFFDPVTNALSFGTLDEDGSHLRHQDPREWGMLNKTRS